jgi:choline dehydrogenase-like flavoprotein
VGVILAKQLTSAGLKVVAFERGPALKTAEYAQRDSISYIARPDQLEGVRHEPRVFRTSAMQPGNLRYGTSPFNVLGGSMLLWTGQASRFMPGDFKIYSNEIASGIAAQESTSAAMMSSIGPSVTMIWNPITNASNGSSGLPAWRG